MLTPQQKLQLYREMENNLSLGFSKALSFFEKKMNDTIEEKTKDFEKIMTEMKSEIKKLQLKDGYTPIKGRDYFTDGEIDDMASYVLQEARLRQPKDGKTPTKDDLLRLIKPLVPKVKDGKTPTINELTSLIKPLIPKVKDGSPDTPEQIATKLNTLDEKVEIKVIKGLKTWLINLQKSLREKTGGQSGGTMGNVQHESTAVSSATTTVTTNYSIACNGYAIWPYYNGQLLVRNTGYTVSDKTLSLLFTPADGTYVDIIYIRS